MQFKKTILMSLSVATLAGAFSACGESGDAKSEKETVGATSAPAGPATITVYSGREEEYVGPLYKMYEQETGDNLKVRYGDSPELAAAIEEEGPNSPADVFFSQDAGSLGALDKSGVFMRLPDSILSLVDPANRAPDGDWVGTSGRSRIVAYDKRKLTASQLPPSVEGYTDSEWSGKIGWAPTNGSFRSFVTAMRILEGDGPALKWLRGIEANDPKTYADNSAIRDAVARGEIEVGFINDYYVYQAQAKDPKYPVAANYPSSGDAGALLNLAGVGILKSSKNQAAAERFVTFLLSSKAQRFFATVIRELTMTPERITVKGPHEPDGVKHPTITPDQLADTKGTGRMLQQAGVL